MTSDNLQPKNVRWPISTYREPNVQPAGQSELNDIAAERQTLLDSFRSGDLTTQRHALERLSSLAENHFPELLSQSVTLISDANRLEDRIRQRTISNNEQDVEIRNLIERGVTLLNLCHNSLPTGRLSQEKITSERINFDARNSFAKQDSTVSADLDTTKNADAEREKHVVHIKEQRSTGKLLVSHDITKTFPQSSFELHPISLELNRGEILGVVGINASGKTTLLRMLLGELSPSRGALLFPTFETHGAERNWRAIKRRIGYVSQILPEWPGKLYDNLCYTASVFGVPRTRIDAQLDLLLKRYGLDKFKDSLWSQLSGGYKARFEIARVLLANPDILILDEPLAYLDIITQQVVLRQLRQLSRNRANPIGIVVTSQQLYEIEAVADRLLVLDGGNILFSGPVNALSKLITYVAIEIGTSESLVAIRKKLGGLPNFRTLFASETGFIALFDNPGQGASGDIFNLAMKALTSGGNAHLSYARDISNSSRLLFEPLIADNLKSESQ